jgi:CrcB protein
VPAHFGESTGSRPANRAGAIEPTGANPGAVSPGVVRPGVVQPTVIDSDVDLHDADQVAETSPREWDLLLTIAAGGVIGALARHGLELLIPHEPGGFPWSTVVVNVSGCLLIGVLMSLLLRRPHRPRLLRPLLGVGVLGGYTTYSTFAADAQALVLAGRPGLALGYLSLTLFAGLTAVALGWWLAGSAGARSAAEIQAADASGEATR